MYWILVFYYRLKDAKIVKLFKDLFMNLCAICFPSDRFLHTDVKTCYGSLQQPDRFLKLNISLLWNFKYLNNESVENVIWLNKTQNVDFKQTCNEYKINFNITFKQQRTFKTMIKFVC